MSPLRVGTRGSPLARAQTGWVADRLRQVVGEVAVETVTTRGDARGDTAVATLGGDGVFVRELEQALLDGRIDVAVHSLKDMPTAEVAGLVLGGVPRRASPFDALVGPPGTDLATLPEGAVVGTASVRRAAQLKLLRPDLEVRPARGNVDTRLRKLDAGEYHAIVLAAAGLERLGLAHRITAILAPPEFWPAVGQGALGLQVRAGDEATQAAVAALDDAATHAAVVAERAALGSLAGGCLAPVAGWGRLTGWRLSLGVRVLEETAAGVREATVEEAARPGETPAGLGRRVAEDLVARGADGMLARMRHPGETSPHQAAKGSGNQLF